MCQHTLEKEMEVSWQEVYEKLRMKHLKENGETYLSHLKFAGTVGLTLIFRGVIFVLHGFFPVCDVPKELNLEGTRDKLNGWNDHAERRIS